MGGLCEDYVFLLQGSLSTCSTALLPLCVYMCACVCLYLSAQLHLYIQRVSLNVTQPAPPSFSLSLSNLPLRHLVLCILTNSLTLFWHLFSMLFPRNVQSSRVVCVCVLSKTISLSQVQTKLNWR